MFIINGLIYLLVPNSYLSSFHYLYFNLSWLILAYSLEYYPTKRNERFSDNLGKLLKLYVFYGLAFFAPFGFSNSTDFPFIHQLGLYLLICLCLFIYRWFFYFLRRKYRFSGGNYVNVVVIGRDKNLKKIRAVFENPYLGYRYLGFFTDVHSTSPRYRGKVENCYGFILENNIDEIYCIASELTPTELKVLIDFADNNLIHFKIIPDNKNIYSRAMSIELFGKEVPVISLRNVPVDTPYGKATKRVFDLVFSTIVIVFILSWLTPLLGVLIKLDSSGPVFFKQKRHGYKRKIFWCYKFRSMKPNDDSDTKMAGKNDLRVSRIGKVLRKTNLDELPQFFNVFMGDMSVVGPRPHMQFHTHTYQDSVDKYLVRHFVKPGITGLAQIKGYRGEIVKPSDIRNRTRLDIFYIEKWTFLLDVSIILSTIVNVIMGEDKAY